MGGNPVNVIDPVAYVLCEWLGGLLILPPVLVWLAVQSGFGSVVAWGLIANGIDNFIAGTRSLDGTYHMAALEAGMHKAIPNSMVAIWHMQVRR